MKQIQVKTNKGVKTAEVVKENAKNVARPTAGRKHGKTAQGQTRRLNVRAGAGAKRSASARAQAANEKSSNDAP